MPDQNTDTSEEIRRDLSVDEFVTMLDDIAPGLARALVRHEIGLRDEPVVELVREHQPAIRELSKRVAACNCRLLSHPVGEADIEVILERLGEMEVELQALGARIDDRYSHEDGKADLVADMFAAVALGRENSIKSALRAQGELDQLLKSLYILMMIPLAHGTLERMIHDESG